MKKVLLTGMIFFVLSFFVFADEMMMHKHSQSKENMKNMENMAEGKDMHGMMGGICKLNADFSIKNTKDGVVITIKAKKDGDDVKTIQEKAKECIEMCNKMSSASDDEEVTCPVMGKKMKKKDAYASMEYKGKMYYFCCASCVDEFKKNPEKYAK